MECKLDNITIHYQTCGEGKPILILHGAPLDHRALLGCMEPIFKNRNGWLRIYPDLPNMGKTREVNWITSADQMLEVVLKVIDQVIPERTVTLTRSLCGLFRLRLTLTFIQIGCRTRSS